MQKTSNITFFPFLLFLLLVPWEGYSAKPIKTVLMFFAWNSNRPAYENMLEGFNDIFSEEPGVTCNLAIEYLDLSRPGNEIVVKTIVDLYNDKYKNIPIDLLVIVGPNGYPVLKQYGLKALENTPILWVDNENLINDTTRFSTGLNMVKISLDYDVYPTLKMAFSLFPDIRDAYVINGSTPIDSYNLDKFKIAVRSFDTTHTVRYFSNYSMDSLILAVESIPRKSLIFVPSFYSDKDGLPYTTSDVMAILARRSKAPVMPVSDVFTLRKGALGGFVISFRNIGKEMGRVANLILQGTSAGDIKIHYRTFYDNIYDWDEVIRWGLTHSKVIPSDSVFLYRPGSFWRIYRWYILAVLLFVISQTIFIMYLVKLNRSQKETARQRAETEKIYHEMVREDRLLKMVELTASLSHELNQPLTAILYNAQAGKRFIKSGKMDLKQAEEIFDYIIEDDKRAGGIISSVKSLMKMERREMENVNLSSLIGETMGIFYSEAVAKNVTTRTNLPVQPVWIFGEKVQLQQVLVNLFRNAINAMENNSSENKLLEIGMKVNKSSVTVSVRDSGHGIDPAIKDKLFKAFVTGSKQGFGIGLALSRTIIQNHHGEIWAANLPDRGAEFCFRLKTVMHD